MRDDFAFGAVILGLVVLVGFIVFVGADCSNKGRECRKAAYAGCVESDRARRDCVQEAVAICAERG